MRDVVSTAPTPPVNVIDQLTSMLAQIVGIAVGQPPVSTPPAPVSTPAGGGSPNGTTTSVDPPDGRACAGNELTRAQAAFDGTTGGWIGLQAHVSWASSPETSTNGSLAVEATQNGPMSAESGHPGTGGLSAAVPGCTYRGGASLVSPSWSGAATPSLSFYDRTGSLLGTVTGQPSAIGPTVWTSLFPVEGLAPESAEFVALVVTVSTSTAGETAFLDDPVLAAAPNPSGPSIVGPLTVKGNQILEASGGSVVLRGFQVDGLESSGNVSGLSQQLIIEAKAWGSNAIRISLGEQLWLSQSCAYDPGYASRVSQVVQWVTSLGMVALLDLHFNSPEDLNSGFGLCPAAAQQVMADFPGSIEFWSQVASTFATNPLVAFDLYNEPHDISDQVWLLGGSVPNFYFVPYQAAGMQQLYDAVRATGARNLVLVSGNDWANTPPTALVSGSNIVYGVHAYTCPRNPPPNCDSSDPLNPVTILGKWVGLSASVPVVVSEFGWPAASDGTYNRKVAQFAQAQGWGWVGFAWSTGPPWGLVGSVAPGGTAEPTPSGMPLLAALSSPS
jgi:endoglucanase